MAGRRDDVLSLHGLDQECSDLSEFSGFEDEEILPYKNTADKVEKTSSSKKSDTVTLESSKNKDKNEKGTGKSNPKAPSKKGKNKAPKNGQENVRDKSKKKNSSAAFDIGNLSSNDILQLRELLGVSLVQNEGPSVFDLYGDNTYNLNVEIDNDGPYCDVEIVPSGAPAKPLNAQLRDALFSDDIQNKENEQMVDDDIPWQLPKLKTPMKGESISASLASLINNGLYLTM